MGVLLLPSANASYCWVSLVTWKHVTY